MALLSLGTLLALGATLAGTAIEARESQAAADRQKKAVQASLRAQEQFQNEKQGRLDKTLVNLTGEARQENQQRRADENFQTIQKVFNRDRPEGLVGESGQTGGKFSQTFNEANAKAVEGNLSDGIESARRLGNYLAIGGAGQDEGLIVNEGAQDQAGINNRAADKANVDRIAIQDAGRVRSSGIGAALKGLGSALSFAGAFTAPASALPVGSQAAGTATTLTGGGGFVAPALKQAIFKPLPLPPGF